MRAHVVLVFQVIAIYSCNNAQMFGGLGAQLQAAQLQRLQQAQLQQAQLQQAQLQQAQLQQQQAALMQQQMGGMSQLGQQQGLPGGEDADEEARKGKGGFGRFGFGGFRPFFGGFNPFFPGMGGFGGFGGFGGVPGFGMGGLPGLGGMGGFGGFGPFGGMFRGATNQLQNGGSVSMGGSTGGKQTNAQLQQFMDQMNEKFNQREQDFDRMKDDFLIELGQKLKEQYGNQVTEAEVQLYLKNVGEQLRTMYGQPESNTEASTTQPAGKSGKHQQSQPTGLKTRLTSATSQKNDHQPRQMRG